MPPQFVESHTPGMFDALGVEVFSTGVHNGDTFTEADLDAMVDTHNKIGKELAPFLKLGHDPKQKLLQKDGYPAAGWVDTVARKGAKLIVDLKAIPRKVKELIERGSYGRFSSEVYFNLKHGNDVYPRALKAVALLGGDTPAVKDLDDFRRLLESEDVAYAYADKDAECREYDYKGEEKKDSTNHKEAEMPEEDKDKLQDKIKKLETQLESMQGKLDASEKENKELKEDNEKDKAKLKAHEEVVTKLAEAEKQVVDLNAEKVEVAKTTALAADNAEVDAAITEAVKDGKVAPAKVATLKALMIGNGDERVVTYTDEKGEKKEVKVTPKAAVLQMIKDFPKMVEFTEDAEHKDKPAPKGSSEGSHDVAPEKVSEYIEDQKKQGVTVGYTDALRAVAKSERGV